MIPLGVVGSAFLHASPLLGYTYLGHVESINNASALTYPTASFGPAYPSRQILAIVHSRTGNTSHNVTSVTIGGVPATLDAAYSGNDTSPGIGPTNTIAFAHANVPLGNSGDVHVTYSTENVRSAVTLAAFNGPVAFAGSVASSLATNELPKPAGDLVVAAALCYTTAESVPTVWEGLTTDADFIVREASQKIGVSQAHGNDSGAVRVTRSYSAALNPCTLVCSYVGA